MPPGNFTRLGSGDVVFSGGKRRDKPRPTRFKITENYEVKIRDTTDQNAEETAKWGRAVHDVMDQFFCIPIIQSIIMLLHAVP
jgi:hypothetical protein